MKRLVIGSPQMLSYLSLTKPRISFLFALTGLAALLIQGTLPTNEGKLWVLVAAIFMVGGSANAFNQYFERDIDAQMTRTAKKRALPQKKIAPLSALIFSILLGCVGTYLLWQKGTLLAALIGLATIIYYSFYYTLWLKPRTPYNIVIGGAAGATGPLIGWAGATGHLSWAALLMFLIIFFWTPPHFWSLALCIKDDYIRVKYPMLPLVIGDEKTRKQILYYSFTLIPLSVALYLTKELGLFYLISSFILGFLFILEAYRLYKIKTVKAARRLFGFSIVYLLLFFGVIITDHFI